MTMECRQSATPSNLTQYQSGPVAACATTENETESGSIGAQVGRIHPVQVCSLNKKIPTTISQRGVVISRAT